MRHIGTRIGIPAWVLALAIVSALLLGITVGSSGKVEQTKFESALVRAREAEENAEQVAADAATTEAAFNDDFNRMTKTHTAQLARAKTLGERRAAEAVAKVAADNAARVAELDGREAELDARAGQLDAREVAVGAAEVERDQRSFGNGVWEVNVDIQAGKYKTAGGGDCYWAKLDRTGDIMDNDLPSGPTTVIIESNVFSFSSQRCGTWTKVG